MANAISSVAYSADVRIELRVNGTRLRVSKIGPDRLYFDTPQTLPAGTGELVLHIDGHERRWRVTLNPADGPARTVRAFLDSN